MTMPNFSKKVMILNVILFWSATFLGGYLLWIKSLPVFLAYSIILVVTIVGFRYWICSPCFYYGKPCPGCGFSYIARIFPKAEGKPFNTKAAMVETGLLILCWLLPILMPILSWTGVIDSYSLLEYVLTGIYVAFVSGSGMAHVITGCNKCENKDCPLCRSSRIS